MKSPNLSSRAVREQLAHRSEPEFVHVFAAVDRLGELHGALSNLYSNPDPTLSTVARARKYRDQYDKATSQARERAQTAVGRLDMLEANIKYKAEQATGLHEHIPHAEAAEIRAALRGMSQEDRDRALQAAVDRGEVKVIQAVRSGAELLTGPLRLPLNVLVAQLVESKNPGIAENLEEIDRARNAVKFAYETFSKEAEGMRDPVAEQRAEQHVAAVTEAERVLAIVDESAA